MKIIKNFFPFLNQKQIDLLELYYNKLIEINTKINLISRNDLQNLEIHLIHSLSPVLFNIFEGSQNCLDFGTGGGLPGIPLSIYYENKNWALCDSVNKKINAVNYFVKELKLKNVQVYCERVENMEGEFDTLTCRAVSNFTNILSYINLMKEKNKIKKIVLFKGGDIKEEFKDKTIISFDGKSNLKMTVLKIFEMIPLEYFKEKYLIIYKK